MIYRNRAGRDRLRELMIDRMAPDPDRPRAELATGNRARRVAVSTPGP